MKSLASSNRKSNMVQIIRRKKIVLFGTGNVSKIILSNFFSPIAYYIDNNSQKWSHTFQGAVVHNPDILYTEDKDNLAIIIASTYHFDITKQLENMGFVSEVHFWNGYEIFEDEIKTEISSKSSSVEKLLQKNTELKNIHKGKRCFILANGPSVANQDLLLLKDDIKIVVNGFVHHSQLEELHPEYWVMLDPLYWTSPERTLYPLLDMMQDKKFQTKLLMPSRAIDSLLVKTSNIPNIEPYFLHFDYKKETIDEMDLSNDVPPWGQNVICGALMLAFHLGCENSFLLGCDHDWWGFTKNLYIEQSLNFSHFYKIPAHLKNKAFAEQVTYDCLMETVKIQRKEYELLRAYGEKKGQYIFNATEGGYLDSFPRIQYESLF